MIIRAINLLKDKGFRYTLKRAMSKYMPNLLLKMPCLIMYPEELMIEPTNICNLRCPLCSNKDMRRKKGLMSYEDFKKIIDNIDIPLKKIIVGITGEPLLNKDVFKMIKYASSKGIEVTLPTNGVLLDNFSTEEILNSGLKGTNIALDGATKKTYEEYRKGSDFERVVKNITNLCKAKREKGLKYPMITVQFLVMKQNEHEIEKMKELCEKIKPDKLFLKTAALWTSLTKGERSKLAEKWLPKESKFKRYNEELKLESPITVCPFVFDSAVILWNGDVALCCLDFEGEYILGNVLKEPFRKIFKSEKYNAIRKAILEHKLELCKECDLTDAEHYGESIYYTDVFKK